jgi:O-acetyl-ADP-ribose deacetylase (regulator of RNase III)
VIEVRRGELADAGTAAILRPVAADGSAVTVAMRRLETAMGPEQVELWRRVGELPPGSAAITPAGPPLTAQWLVHAVVRSADEQVSAALVRQALQNGLRRIAEWGIDSVAMPPLGTGAGNLDAEESAAVMLAVLADHTLTAAHPSRVEIVVESEYEQQAFAAAVSRAGLHPAGDAGPPHP